MEANLKKLVICGATGINNSGDEAILDVLLHQYADSYLITVICLDAAKASRYHPGVSFVSIQDSKNCQLAIQQCDIFLLGGGGLFQDETSVFNVLRWYSILHKAVSCGKQTLVYANSMGPLRHKWSRRLVRNILNQVDAITLRDHMSYDLLQDIGVTTSMKVTADPVFSYTFYDKTVSRYVLPERYVAIAIRHWYDSIPLVPAKISSRLHLRSRRYNNYVTSLRSIVKYTNDTYKLPVVFLSFLTERDRKVALDVLDTEDLRAYNVLLGDSDATKVDVTDGQILPREMFPIIQNAEYLIGMRLHSLIYAVNVRTPFIAIDYSSKVRGLLRELKLEDYTIPVNELSLDAYRDVLQLLQDTQEDVCRQMKEQGTAMRVLETANQECLSAVTADIKN